MSGLFLVTTPIGNNSDFTPRAIEYLNSAKIIFCEDTRVFRALAKACEIDLENKYINSFHDHSGESKLKAVIESATTENCAFVSDAGSPLISDPAFPLVKLAISEGISLHSSGGISSPVVALELSGLPPTPFHFHGFLARDQSKKKRDLETVGSVYGTHIFFEGVSRVIKTIQEFCIRFPDMEMAIARELTKTFETIHRFKGSEFESIREEIVEKGEFIFLIHNPQKDQIQNNEEAIKFANEILEKGAKTKLVAKLVAQVLDTNVKEIYNQLNREDA